MKAIDYQAIKISENYFRKISILENKKMDELRKNVSFCFWEKYDENHSVVRFATSWSTKEEDIEELRKIL